MLMAAAYCKEMHTLIRKTPDVCQLHGMAQPISLRANSMKGVVLGPEVLMNIHVHMHRQHLDPPSFQHQQLCCLGRQKWFKNKARDSIPNVFIS